MALITCVECGARVSDAASACPKCGYPIGELFEKEPQRPRKGKHQETTRASVPRWIWFALLPGIGAVVILSVVITVLIVSRPTKTEKESPAKTDKESLQGEWDVVYAEESSHPDRKSVGTTLTFAGDRCTMIEKTRKMELFFTIDEAKNPRQIDIRPKGEASGGLGIYELNNDDLKICFDNSNRKNRPMSFQTRPSSDDILLVLKRKKQ